MHWNTMSTKQRIGTVALTVAAFGLVTLAERGPDGTGGGPDPAEVARADARLETVAWSSPDDLIRTQVPAGWTVSGEVGSAVDLGQFRIEAASPDGASFVTIAHNWLSFPESQYGTYRPGAATIEDIVLPVFLQSHPRFINSRVIYRGAPSRQLMPTPVGIPIPFDSGVVGFLLQRRDGGFSAGTAMGETVDITASGTPGLWRLRLFAAAYAPAEAGAQAAVTRALTTAYDRLDLSPEFFGLWHQASADTARQMREYRAQMDRVFSRYLRSAVRSSSDGRNPMDGWASMMRGGAYAQDASTGEQYWVSSDHDYWWINARGDVVATDTPTVPTGADDWRQLQRP